MNKMADKTDYQTKTQYGLDSDSEVQAEEVGYNVLDDYGLGNATSQTKFDLKNGITFPHNGKTYNIKLDTQKLEQAPNKRMKRQIILQALKSELEKDPENSYLVSNMDRELDGKTPFKLSPKSYHTQQMLLRSLDKGMNLNDLPSTRRYELLQNHTYNEMVDFMPERMDNHANFTREDMNEYITRRFNNQNRPEDQQVNLLDAEVALRRHNNYVPKQEKINQEKLRFDQIQVRRQNNPDDKPVKLSDIFHMAKDVIQNTYPGDIDTKEYLVTYEKNGRQYQSVPLSIRIIAGLQKGIKTVTQEAHKVANLIKNMVRVPNDYISDWRYYPKEKFTADDKKGVTHLSKALHDSRIEENAQDIGDVLTQPKVDMPTNDKLARTIRLDVPNSVKAPSFDDITPVTKPDTYKPVMQNLINLSKMRSKTTSEFKSNLAKNGMDVIKDKDTTYYTYTDNVGQTYSCPAVSQFTDQDGKNTGLGDGYDYDSITDGLTKDAEAEKPAEESESKRSDKELAQEAADYRQLVKEQADEFRKQGHDKAAQAFLKQQENPDNWQVEPDTKEYMLRERAKKEKAKAKQKDQSKQQSKSSNKQSKKPKYDKETQELLKQKIHINIAKKKLRDKDLEDLSHQYLDKFHTQVNEIRKDDPKKAKKMLSVGYGAKNKSTMYYFVDNPEVRNYMIKHTDDNLGSKNKIKQQTKKQAKADTKQVDKQDTKQIAKTQLKKQTQEQAQQQPKPDMFMPPMPDSLNDLQSDPNYMDTLDDDITVQQAQAQAQRQSEVDPAELHDVAPASMIDEKSAKSTKQIKSAKPKTAQDKTIGFYMKLYPATDTSHQDVIDNGGEFLNYMNVDNGKTETYYRFPTKDARQQAINQINQNAERGKYPDVKAGTVKILPKQQEFDFNHAHPEPEPEHEQIDLSPEALERYMNGENNNPRQEIKLPNMADTEVPQDEEQDSDQYQASGK